jgi:hypothetical protein
VITNLDSGDSNPRNITLSNGDNNNPTIDLTVNPADGNDGTYNVLGYSNTGILIQSPVTGNYYIMSDTVITDRATVDETLPQYTFYPTADRDGVTPYAPPACFAAGTLIRTARGEVAVEDLREGDMVLTVGGTARPVIWIGHRTVDCMRHPRPETVRPVRILAGAFGDALPARDLLLSPDHALFIGGALVPVKCLVNGASIAQLETDSIAYYHVELPTHDVLFAEGLPAETYLDTGNRSAFANGGAVMQAHPDFAPHLNTIPMPTPAPQPAMPIAA